MNSMVEKLETAGLKPSYQRVKILEFMLQQDTHPTADQVYLELKTSIPTLAKATVYNTLHALAEKGLIRALSGSQPGTRYDQAGRDHGHFICKVCDRIYDFPYDYIDGNLEGFAVDSQEIVQKGTCRLCLENTSQSSSQSAAAGHRNK